MSKKTYYGKQTIKALNNFPFSYPLVHFELLFAISEIKEAAALAHYENHSLSAKISQAICQACQEIRQGIFNDQFPLTALQGGAGTSINMNMNEVIASRAEEIIAQKHGNISIHPNDHVNKSQSTNDVNPTALKIASIRLTLQLLTSIDSLIKSLEMKAIEFTEIHKIGRTHLQDAVPTTLGEEFSAYADIIKRDRERLYNVLPFLYELNLGGTAIGNSINASSEYRRIVYKKLNTISLLRLKPARNTMSQTSSQTDFVMLSQAITLLALDISKIANDLRLLSSGPYGGIGEIILEELQSGSTIMPGKVNPILPETINQLYFMVSGNNSTIEQAAHAAQLELGVMFPILADRLISSLKISNEVINKFATTCIPTIRANRKRCYKHLEESSTFATLLTPELGYDMVSSLVKESIRTDKTLREIITTKKIISEDKFNQIINSYE